MVVKREFSFSLWKNLVVSGYFGKLVDSAGKCKLQRCFRWLFSNYIYIYIYMYIFAVFWGICCHLKPDNKDTHMAWLERESLFPLGHLFLSHLSFTASSYVTNFEYTSKTFKTVSFQLWYKVCMSLYWGLFTWLKHTYTNVLGASCHQYYDITVLHF